MACEKVEKIPNDVDGLKHYVLKDKSRSVKMVGNGREIPAQNGLAMIASGIKIARDLSPAQMLIVIISRNMIKKIASTLTRKVNVEYVKYVEQSASRNLAIVGSMLHFRAIGLMYFILEFIHLRQKS